MKQLSEEPQIISMAHSLGIHEGDCVEEIKEFCRRKVRNLIAKAGPISSIDELERIVCDKLNVTIVEVWNDSDLTALIEKYARQEKNIGFAALRKDLDAETFATLLRRKCKPGETGDHYVAVIDCRGEKGTRRFFTRWHEIAHVLTQVEQLQLPLHRSTVKKDPVEKMMDIIAGDIGFFDSLFSPLLIGEVARNGGLTFASVENVRNGFSPVASMEATLNACAARLKSPVVVLQAAMGFKREEERAMQSGQTEMFPTPKPVPQLRIVSAMPNPAARDARLMVPNNMRVPLASIIASVFADGLEFEAASSEENMNWWRSSDGKVLSHAHVQIEAMKVRDRVWAIVTPLSSRGRFRNAA